MAKRKAPALPILTERTLSDQALWMIAAFGMNRLKMMREEYEAGLPKSVPEHIRQQRIAAINEIYKL